MTTDALSGSSVSLTRMPLGPKRKPHAGQTCLFVFLSLAMLFAACSADDPAGAGSGESSDDDEVQMSTHALSEGRKVEVELWRTSGGDNTPSGKVQVNPFEAGPGGSQTSRSPADVMGLACIFENGIRIFATGNTGTCNTQLNMQVVANCMAHWALTFAQATVPYYMVRGEVEPSETFALVDDPKKIPDFYLEEPFNINPTSWNQYAEVEYAVYPPTATNAASWSLFAADMFRQSALMGTDLLNPEKCPHSDLDRTFTNAAGDTLSLEQAVAANLSDALSGAIESAELAQKYVNASAAAKTATVSDRQTAQIKSWRDRHDSRLEGASAFVPVPGSAYEGRGLVELVRMVQKDASGEVLNYMATTTPELFARYGFERDVTLGLIYELQPNPVADVKPLYIWRDNYQDIDRWSTNADGSEASPPCVGGGCSRHWSSMGRQGWVPTAADTGMIALRQYWKVLDDAYAHYVLAPEGQQPAGWNSVTGDTIYVLDPEQVEAAGEYPVVTAFATSAADRRAEELLRTYRVNPFLGMTPVSGMPGDFALEDALLAAMNIDQGGSWNRLLDQPSSGHVNPSNWNYQAKGFALLQELGISRDELRRAAHRIQQTAKVLGRPITVNTDATVVMGEGEAHHAKLERVTGTEWSPVPVDPWYLHALTGGAATPPKDTTSDSNWRVTSDHALQGILHTLDYFRDTYMALSVAQRNALGDATRHMLESAMAWVKTQITGRVVVGLPLGESPSPYQFLVLDTPAASDAEVEDRYDVWLGELGLRCALGQGAEGCESSDEQHIQDEANWSRATTTIGDVTRARAVLSVEASLILFGTRVYITEKTERGRAVIASLTVTPGSGPNDGSQRWYAIPYGPALTRALSTSLAVDPTNPEESMISCAGVPRDVKFGLENELTEGVTGADDIESSYAYYLKLAREAASTADNLGDQLVEQGLQMDLRAEEAREELEALCGGVINVGRLEEAACADKDCDIVKLLEEGSESVPGDAQLEVENLRRCLGIEGGGLDWATIGNVDLCVWQWKETASRVHPPCVCPPGIEACEDLACALPLRSDQNCGELLAGTDTPLPDIDDVTAPGLGARKLDKNLNIYVTSADGQAKPKSGNTDEGVVMGCRDILRWRKESLNPTGNWEGLRNLYEWVNQKDLRLLAERIGYTEDEIGVPTVTLGGAPWLTFGGRENGMGDPAELGWPCTPHPELNGSDPDAPHDKVGVELCESFFEPTDRPFLCGGLCNGACTSQGCNVGIPAGCGEDGCTDAEQQEFYDGVVNGWLTGSSLKKRLRDAVVTLKGITGASWNNVARRETVYMAGPGGTQSRDPKLFKGPIQDMGLLPDWVPSIGGTPWISSLDGQSACWEAPAYSADAFQCSYLLPSERPELRCEKEGADTGGGWPLNPQFLWSTTCDVPQVLEANGFSPGNQGGRVNGCGNLLYVFDLSPRNDAWFEAGQEGDTLELELFPSDSEVRCPTIPSDVCLYHYQTPICGEGLRHRNWNCIWDPPFDDPGPCESLTQPTDDFYEKYRCDYISGGCYVGSKVKSRAVIDALELACAVKSQETAGCETLLRASPNPNSAADFPSLAAMLRCAADNVELTLERMFVGELSSETIGDLSKGAVAETLLSNRGQYGEVVAELVGKLQSLRSYSEAVVQGLRDMSLEFEASELELQKLGLAEAIENVQTRINQLNVDKEDAHLEIAQVQTRAAISRIEQECAQGMIRGVWGLVAGIFGGSIGDGVMGVADAGLNCAISYNIDKRALEDVQAIQNDIAQINNNIREALTKQAELRGELTEKEKLLYMVDLARKLSEQWDKINESRRLLVETYTGIQGLMIKLDDQRMQARRAAAKVLMLESDDLGRQYAVNSAMRARMNTLRVRYERARDHAIRMSYLARRALEQKIGMDLSMMNDPIGWVPAPRSWADTVCTQKGINYNEVRTGGRISEEEASSIVAAQGPYNYADRYIGEYVSLLEQFMEAYQHEYPFQDGEDVAVISLRDEILGVRAPKLVQGPNLLLWSQNPGIQGEPEAWSLSCDGEDCAALEGISESGPFFCRDAEENILAASENATCRPFGLASAVRLGMTADTSAASLPLGLPAPSAWYRADRCTDSGDQTVCTDLSASARDLFSWSPSARPLVGPLTINGWPALNFHGGAYEELTTEAIWDMPTLSSYTLTFVGQGTTGGDFSWRWVNDMPSGFTAMGLITHDDYVAFTQTTEYGGNNVEFMRVQAELPDATAPFIVTVRVADTHVDLFVNGELAASYDGPTLPLKDAYSLTPSWVARRWGELIKFDSAVSNLGPLHDYLRERYLTSNGGQPRLAAYRQSVPVSSGTYLLSWYQLATETRLTPSATQQTSAGNAPVLTALPSPIYSILDTSTAPVGATTEDWLASGWVRHVYRLEIREGGSLVVGWEAPAGSTLLAAPQLERWSGVELPGDFFPTAETTQAAVGAEEDHDGEYFRRLWSEGEEYYCPAGTGALCSDAADPTGLPTKGYREVEFSLSQNEIEKGVLIPQAGFAKGNFNYRFASVALNVAGTAVKRCSTSSLPSTCYANNFLQYSIFHDGPYSVRNYVGDVYKAPLYPGRVRGGKALLAERYITNPISSADRNLLSDYWQGQLKGRPLEGNYRLRIYNADGLNWDAIKDVQLVIRYRYWTRLQ